ncbi:nucleotidyltransferase substrate binding protein [Methylocucumis oryzae]|uniref:nucleotidyltransferase substrate binding protein n=1 Tax=Methylocucumis oryzae TaxID=1632867 RepID=UPI0009E4E96B
MTFNELIRRGYALGLLQAEISTWQAFRKDRGTTSHTYDETKAAEIFLPHYPLSLMKRAFCCNKFKHDKKVQCDRITCDSPTRLSDC